MSRKTKIGLAIVIALIILAIALLLLLRRPAELPVAIEEAAPPPGAPTGLVAAPGTGINVNAPAPGAPAPEVVPPPPPDERENLRRLSAAFAERYGSFSNTSDFENVLDLKAFMTASFAAETDRFVARERQKPRRAEYFGVTTRALSSEVTAFAPEEARAEVRVRTQKNESSAEAPEPRVFYEDIILSFLRVNGIWRVNAAEWE